MKRKLFVALILITSAIAAVLVIRETANAPDTPFSRGNQLSNSTSFNKKLHSIDDPASIWIIVNKKRPLPDGHEPNDLAGQLRREPASHIQDLLVDAGRAGHNLRIVSAYRTQSYQASTYSEYVQSDGKASADKYSARPRHSEHQTGLAVDVGDKNGECELEICFGSTPAGKWLASNAHKYGFIIRYHRDKENITGYQYEPWHLRYAGKELASELYKTNQTMEEFFGVPGGGY